MRTKENRWPTMAVSFNDVDTPKLTVGMLTFPGVTLLDLLGPQGTLCGPMETHLVWKDTLPVMSDTGVEITPTMSFADGPDRFDILFVPGGPGQVELFHDEEVLNFLRHQGEAATWVTSVCTGSMILGAAGLLTGYRAATHWAGQEVLRLFGAEPVDERVVRDRNRITGGGVTAGIDFGLELLRECYDEETAKTTQLLMEYDPAPPFECGSLKKSDEKTVQRALEILAPVAQLTIDSLAKRFE